MKKDIEEIISELGNLVGTDAEFQLLEERLALLNDIEMLALKECLSIYFEENDNIPVYDVIYIAKQVWSAIIRPEIKTPADFGYFVAHELDMLSIDYTYRKFFDYDGFGRYLLERLPGRFTKSLFIWKNIRILPF